MRRGNNPEKIIDLTEYKIEYLGPLPKDNLFTFKLTATNKKLA